ncbi:sel1 repeat family protein [Kribbella catacumbae]|uniref:sel1 repeat family protein n=1 Tax=Kribbella catacumbae TaxID=460086 RepID=UPI0003A8084C|nr:sel1 repeat family protein [Kribbella catacumbae]
MTLFLFAAAAGFTLAAVLTDNRPMLYVGLGLWTLGALTALWAWTSSRRHAFRTPEEARAAAEAGNPQAIRTLALAAKSTGDHDQAERLLLQAIDHGDVDSMWEMGRLIESRDGIDASDPWYRMAADNGHFAARRFLKRRALTDGENSDHGQRE